MFDTIKIKLQIIKATNDLIRLGKSDSEIKRKLLSDTEGLDIKLVEDIVDDTINNHGYYNLVQKVMNSKLVVDIETDEIRVVDVRSRDYTAISDRTLRNILDKRVDIESLKYYCRFEYEPFSNAILWEAHDGVWRYNTYQPPEWYSRTFYSKGEVPVAKSKMPEMYKKFFSHLTAHDQDSYNYIISWLANGLQDRNFCILATIGDQGVGKGVLGNIMRGLFGKYNYYAGSDRMFKTKFNSQIRNKRLVYCDEISIRSKEDEDKLKLVVNDFIEVEQKGIDAEEIVNYANFYISSNNLDAIRLSGDDRRFSIVNLTDIKLIEVFSDSEIKELLSQKNINQLARYLYHSDVDKEWMKKVFVSERTAEVRESSLLEWHDYFLDEYCVDHAGETIPQTIVSEDIHDKYGSKFRPSRKALQDLRNRLTRDKRCFDIKKKTIEDKQVWCIIFDSAEKS